MVGGFECLVSMYLELRTVASEGGFSRFRRAAESPFNLVFEARI